MTTVIQRVGPLTVAPNAGVGTATATCQGSERAIAGGWRLGVSEFSEFHVTGSELVSLDTWKVLANNSGESKNFRATVICASP